MNDLASIVRSTVNSLTSTDIRRVHERLRDLALQGHFVASLKQITFDRAALRSIAKRSYLHYNDFDKIVLMSGKNDAAFELRLHVWWANPDKVGCENVHDHKWDFSSVILDGGYDYEVFEVAESGQEMLEFCYATREGKRRYDAPFRGKKALTCTARGMVSRGDAYSLRHDVLHRITSDRSRTTMTLVAQGRDVKETARVFTDSHTRLPKRIEAECFSSRELKNRLDYVIQTMDDARRIH